MLRRIKKGLTTTQMIAYGFLTAIFTGSVLLTLPVSSIDGKVTPYIDALFTSTSAICVTGLTTVVTAEHWSFFGQIVILCLIQFGGLGVVTFITSIMLILHRRISLKDRMLIQDGFNLNTLGGLVKLTKKVIKGTFIVEGAGAFFYSFVFIPEFGFFPGVWKSVFHSVSAFCNAGIDLVAADSFTRYAANPIVNITTMCLIVSGGIGYPVWWDIIRIIKKGIEEKLSFRKAIRKLELHSKIALSMTLLLIFGGAAIIMLLEYNNTGTIGDMSFGGKFMASCFQSVTTRTAGFFTFSQSALKSSTAFLCILLMFIGGSPSGTAGGIKTVTLVVIIWTTIAVIRGKDDTEIYGRKLIIGYAKKALAVTCFSTMVLLTSTMLLSVVQDAAFLDILYETTSAIATVGLSRDLTPNLTFIGKVIIITTMYLGRIGPITLALIFNPKSGKGKGKGWSLPEADVMIG